MTEGAVSGPVRRSGLCTAARKTSIADAALADNSTRHDSQARRWMKIALSEDCREDALVLGPAALRLRCLEQASGCIRDRAKGCKPHLYQGRQERTAKSKKSLRPLRLVRLDYADRRLSILEAGTGGSTVTRVHQTQGHPMELSCERVTEGMDTHIRPLNVGVQ